MNEVWRDIPGYEGLYQVSDCGNVRSLNYRNKRMVRQLCFKPHRQGYLQVELHNRGERKTFTVHRLVGVAFVDGYADGLIINHKDENKKNNHYSNLEWCTVSDNVKHSLHHRISPPRRNYPKYKPRKDKQKVCQLNNEGEILRVWDSTIAVKAALGYSDSSIKQCCRGNRKTAYGFKWQYAI